MEQTPKRVRVTPEQIIQMREHRRIIAQEEAQRRSPEAQPSVPRRPILNKISAFAVRTHTREI